MRLGDARTRLLYQALLVIAFSLTLMLATPWAAVGLLALPLAVRARNPWARAAAARTPYPGAARH